MEADMTDDNLDQVRAMTVGELVDGFNLGTIDDWLKMEKILAQIIWDAEEAYNDRLGFELDIRSIALRIAGIAFEGSIDRIKAEEMVREIAFLGHAMLRTQEDGTLGWYSPTLVALRKIRSSDPNLEQVVGQAEQAEQRPQRH
jgi:hypothetical protein